MADLLIDVADTLVSDFDIIDFLHNLAVHASELTGSPAVGLLLSDLSGGLDQVAASSEDAQTLELLQLQHSEGPCVECYRTGRAVIEEDLAGAQERWPNFAPRAVAAGISKVHAFPMRLRDDVIGALNVFGRPGDVMGPDDVRLVQSLADFATIAILQERALSRAESLSEQLQFALNSRIVIEQAKGAVARSLGIGVDEAFDILRSHARRTQQRLTELARAVVIDRDVMETLRPAQS
ncbi:ANTAR domain-containing protein [Nocardioides immobilis]|uniref:ANTAR domain-containing protein n=2 Tax=Nocardioides immobilis TaxID=2049295 RepID=A0A417XU73_9ACTN|nr:ANTAR domain-containing protein [Nocardioides immobilis]